MNHVSVRCVLCGLLGLLGCSDQSMNGDVAPPLTSTAMAGAPAQMPPAPVMPAAAGAMSADPGVIPPATGPAMMAGAPAQMPSSPAMMDPPKPGEQMPPGMEMPPQLKWDVLVSADWQLEVNEETTYCQRVTLKEDVYFKAIRALNPLGTHHTATTLGDPSSLNPDGLTRDCGSALSPQGIFGSGVGTDTVLYPPGVGMRLRAGQQILLNLHVYNVTGEPLKGTSGVEVVLTSEDEIEQAAESLLAGPAFFSLPAGRKTAVQGTCTVNEANTLFAVQPHMHQLGVHMKGVAHTANGDVLLHDGPFDFERQVVVPIEPLKMAAGDTIDIECTFDNTTTASVGFGESSDTEMCFLVLHRYPAAQEPQVICPF